MADPFEWDAKLYGELPLPHVAWGAGVLSRLEASQGATVLELACGSGRDAARLLGCRPDVSLLGVDGSEQMLAAARDTLAPHGGRFELRHADLRHPQDFGNVGAAYSVAALHWLPDHGPVFASVARALTSGGRFVVDAGGHGNLARLNPAIESVFGPGRDVWNFATAEDTAELLERSGLRVIDARLREEPVVFPAAAYRPYLATVVLGSHLTHLPAEQRADAVAAVAAAMGEPVVDYVRLEFEAVAPRFSARDANRAAVWAEVGDVGGRRGSSRAGALTASDRALIDLNHLGGDCGSKPAPACRAEGLGVQQ